MNIIGTVADLLPEATRPLVLRVVEFVCGQPVPDDSAPPSRRVKDMTGSKREPGEADPLNLAAEAHRAAQSEGTDSQPDDVYAQTLRLNEAHERHMNEGRNRSLDCYEYGARMAAAELRQRGRFGVTLSDAELFD
jgi:hypothetical protein